MVLLLSALAITGLTALAWCLGFRAAPALDCAAARALASETLPGFRAADVALADDGRSALVRDRGDSLALILPLGDRFLVRRLPADAALVRCEGGLRIDAREPLLRAARLPLAAAPDWLAGRLAT